MRPNREVVDLAKRLRAHYRLAILSNIDRSDYSLALKLFDKNLFSDRFLSCYMHSRKPDKRNYEVVLERLRLKPEEVVFIDDSKGHVEAARSLGINALHFTSYKELVKDLRALGVTWA